MPVQIKCQNCGATVKILGSLTSQSINCPKCGSTIDVKNKSVQDYNKINKIKNKLDEFYITSIVFGSISLFLTFICLYFICLIKISESPPSIFTLPVSHIKNQLSIVWFLAFISGCVSGVGLIFTRLSSKNKKIVPTSLNILNLVLIITLTIFSFYVVLSYDDETSKPSKTKIGLRDPDVKLKFAG